MKFLIHLSQAEHPQLLRAMPLSDLHHIMWWQMEKAKPTSLFLLVVLLRC